MIPRHSFPIGLALAFVAAWISLPAAAGDFRIVAVSSRNEAPYRQALEGFRQQLAERGVASMIETHSLETDSTAAERAIQGASGKNDTLFLTFGATATQAVSRQSAATPVVACLVLDADNLRQTDNIAGVTLDFPLETQVAWIRKFLPEARTVGVLYNPAGNRKKIGQAEILLRKSGLTLYAREVARPQDLPDALEKMAKNQVDVLWSLPDPLIFSPQTAKPILLFSFRNRIPLIGLSDAWVKAGALYALEWDYEDIGKQCASVAMKIIQGARLAALPPAPPRKMPYSVNARTASHMNLEIPVELLKQARQVYE